MRDGCTGLVKFSGMDGVNKIQNKLRRKGVLLSERDRTDGVKSKRRDECNIGNRKDVHRFEIEQEIDAGACGDKRQRNEGGREHEFGVCQKRQDMLHEVVGCGCQRSTGDGECDRG